MRKINYFSPAIITLYIVLGIITVVTIFPVAYAFFGSFKPNQEFVAGGARLLPETWRLTNYSDAWQIANFARYTWNSVFVSAFSVVGSLLVISMAGYVLDRFRFPGRRLIMVALLATLFLTTGSVTLYPTFRIARFLGIHRSLLGIIVVYVFRANTAFVFLFLGYLGGISKELDQAATIDGCNSFGIYWRIILPLAKPILATLALLGFKFAWNDYLLPLVFTMASPDMRTLTVGVISLRNTQDGAAAWNLMLAGTTISLVPIIVIYLITNKYFIRGITAGAVKG
jgi:ABC-type glycerol-3-phosphate transport system permease component